MCLATLICSDPNLFRHMQEEAGSSMSSRHACKVHLLQREGRQVPVHTGAITAVLLLLRL